MIKIILSLLFKRLPQLDLFNANKTAIKDIPVFKWHGDDNA